MRMRLSGEGADVMQRGRYSTPPPENKRSAENEREKISHRGHQYRVLRRALDDGYFGQPDNKEVETKENVFIPVAMQKTLLQ